MTGLQHLILAYIISFTLLGGYVIHLWTMHRRLARQQRSARTDGIPRGRHSTETEL